MVSSITLKNLIIGYRSKHQLRAIASPVHASLQAGELTCLIGANGVGKSTLLRTLAGFQPALDGEILIQDKSLSDFSAQELAREISIVLLPHSASGISKTAIAEVLQITVCGAFSPYSNPFRSFHIAFRTPSFRLSTFSASSVLPS
jgi:ABC-type cobalamin/Fe3+-siderophores transport system ATPase subunit